MANGHFFLIGSKSTSIEGTCLSGCTSSTTYQWTVTDSATSIPLTIDSALTTTGLNKKNFVLKAGALPSGNTYTFKLEAEEGSEMGQALFSLPPSSKPSGGSCSVMPTTPIVPLQDVVTVVCSNFQDTDLMSGIYYQIKVTSNSINMEKYLAYYGTSAENQIFVAPLDASLGSVQVTVSVINDYGAAADGTST